MHKPVLLEETVSALVLNPHGIYCDCTMGGAGHLRRMLSLLEADAQVVAIDKDKQVLEECRRVISRSGIRFVHDDFRNLKAILQRENIPRLDGIMIDLGVSSYQLDNAERGFSFHEDAGLDMRMDQEQTLTARDIVNRYAEQELIRILFDYGEERYARKIARAVLNYRQDKDINTTLELVEIIKAAVPAAYRREKHPARRTFQALRIAVNGELDALQEVLPQALEVLKPGGRLCIITFHSLEDRIVKRFFQEKAKGCICPPGMPMCICGQKPQLQIVSRRPITPGDDECIANPRARSAKLRVAGKL